MLSAFRYFAMAAEWVLSAPIRLVHLFLQSFVLNPQLGPLRHVVTGAVVYVLAAVALVYVVAPVRGLVGKELHAQELRYDAQRWLATTIYDGSDRFVGMFDPRLDSKRDVNFTDEAIEVAGLNYVANPDHKSIPVRRAPEYYWRCLVYHEDRYMGTWLNPAGIDLLGVLKIPYTTVTRTISSGRIRFGVGGSTIPMQLARVIYKTPPRSGEGALVKIRRKLTEWWMAPVIYASLTANNDAEPLKEWASNHLWLAQRGAGDLHGVESTARIVFNKTAPDLTPSEQFVLAAAVNKPIMLLSGSDRVNRARLSRWRYVVDVRARACASKLLTDPRERKEAFFELTAIANNPPDPQIESGLAAAIDASMPSQARAASANPAIRANLLLPAVRYGVRAEMKDEYGYDWRNHVRGVKLAINADDNRALRARLVAKLGELNETYSDRIDPDYTLDPTRPNGRLLPDVVVAAADAKGQIVRYFEAKSNAAYFGSAGARDSESGRYEMARESRAIASVGKMIAAITIANGAQDTGETRYLDRFAPSRGLETCRKGDGGTRGMRRAIVAFACSLNPPIEWRSARAGQARVRNVIDGFALNMPPRGADGSATPASTAAVRGYVTGSPRTVHHMAGVILAALTGRDAEPIARPSLVRTWERFDATSRAETSASPFDIVPAAIINRAGHGRLKSFLSAPLCYRRGGK
ncbi:MAG: transglycosylase domain-containing protein, partial [Pseudomonadota bacterium]